MAKSLDSMSLRSEPRPFLPSISVAANCLREPCRAAIPRWFPMYLYRDYLNIVRSFNRSSTELTGSIDRASSIWYDGLACDRMQRFQVDLQPWYLTYPSSGFEGTFDSLAGSIVASFVHETESLRKGDFTNHVCICQ